MKNAHEWMEAATVPLQRSEDESKKECAKNKGKVEKVKQVRRDSKHDKKYKLGGKLPARE